MAAKKCAGGGKGGTGMEEAALQAISPVFVGWHDCGQVLHTHRSQSYGRRVVRHYEIEYIVFSHSGYILTDGLPLQTIPHTVFVRRPGMEAEGVGVYRSVFVEFDPDEAARRLAVLDGLPPVIFQTEEPTFGEDFFQSLALPPRPEPWQLLAWKSRMLWLLAGLLRQAAAGGGHSPGDDAPVRQALAYIHRHYRENVTLEQLAAAAGYSSGYFCKLFKKVTGLSPLQYVVRCRLEQAKKRMLTTRDPLETIMPEVGFHNYGYFWRMFKAVYGLSPQAFRQQGQNGLPPGQGSEPHPIDSGPEL